MHELQKFPKVEFSYATFDKWLWKVLFWLQALHMLFLHLNHFWVVMCNFFLSMRVLISFPLFFTAWGQGYLLLWFHNIGPPMSLNLLKYKHFLNTSSMVIGGLGDNLLLWVQTQGQDYKNKPFDQQYGGKKAAKHVFYKYVSIEWKLSFHLPFIHYKMRSNLHCILQIFLPCSISYQCHFEDPRLLQIWNDPKLDRSMYKND